MNFKLILSALVTVFIMAACNNKQTSITAGTANETENRATTSTFKVWGNCEMCKKTIESSLKTEGITKADWNVDSKIITVTYDNSRITLEQIQKNIASVGYDNEKFKGDDDAYKNLPECCQYKRK